MKKFIEGHWVFDIDYLAYRWIPDGEYNAAVAIDRKDSIFIDDRMASKLLKYMEENRHIPLTVNQSLHQDDLKIVHRLIDIIEKNTQ